MSGLDVGGPEALVNLKLLADFRCHRTRGPGGILRLQGLLACVGAASHRSDLGLKRLRRKHKGPEWLD